MRKLLCLLLALSATPSLAQPTLFFEDGFESGALEAWPVVEPGFWAFTEPFDGDPAAPSQALLPASFDFAVTHRTHPRNHDPGFEPFPADHGADCAGPSPPIAAQHLVTTTHATSGAVPDESFFVCKNHMMSSMGEVDGYSVTSFWPRQEFDFAGGGVLEFDVNINAGHPRSWWEVLIAPRHLMKIGAAQDWLPIDETYPSERIVLTFSAQSKREIQVGTGAVAPAGWIVDASDWRRWADVDSTDPALADRRIRRRMRVELLPEEIIWSVEKQDGTFDSYSAPVPGGLPFTRGLVLFKTHAYTPEKDDNFDLYTYHWDNLRFSGPVVGRYRSYETAPLVYLQANGSRPIGDSGSAVIDLPDSLVAPVLAGQVHGAMTGQIILSINGGPNLEVHPIDYGNQPDCSHTGWASFRLPVDPAQLVPGPNTFTWTVGPRPACAESWLWDGFSIKSLEVQADLF